VHAPPQAHRPDAIAPDAPPARPLHSTTSGAAARPGPAGRHAAIAAATAFALGGCAVAGTPPAAVRTLDSAGYTICPWRGDEPRVVDIATDADWRALLATGGDMATRVAGWAPDFERDHVVLAAIGKRQSAGYRVEWLDAAVSGAELRARVSLEVPAAGLTSAMMITTPCVVGWVRAPGAERTVVVDAATGRPIVSAR
jgi:hypothetical protein